MSSSYGVDYFGAISGTREDLEKIPAIMQKIAAANEPGLFELDTLSKWYKEDTKAIAVGAEKALSSNGPYAFAFTAEEDDSSHEVMDDIMKTLDEKLPGLVIFLDAMFDHRDRITLIFPPGQSILKLSYMAWYSSRSDWNDRPFQNCEALTCLRIPRTDVWGTPRKWTIDPHQFKGCINLTDIVLPDTVMKIAKTAFKDCKNLTIHAPVGSYAETYAKEREIPFQVL